MKLTAFYHQRIEAVQLKKIHERFEIGVPYARLEPHIAAAILVHIAVIAVALREIRILNEKAVIVALKVAVLA